MKPAKDAHIIWLPKGWQPVQFGFCPSKRAWKKEMRRLGNEEDYPQSAGRTCLFFKAGVPGIVVTLNATKIQSCTRVEIAGILAHEATHVWQLIREQIGEESPGMEMEAYAIQAIFQGLYQAWLDTMAPDALKAASATRRAAR